MKITTLYLNHPTQVGRWNVDTIRVGSGQQEVVEINKSGTTEFEVKVRNYPRFVKVMAGNVKSYDWMEDEPAAKKA